MRRGYDAIHGTVCGAVLVALLAAGCGEGCPEVSACDVRGADCQRATMEAVVCMRGGGGGDLPRVSVLSEGQYLERIRAMGAEDPTERAQAEAEYRLWVRGLSLFGLAPVDYDRDAAVADSVAQTAAAYFPTEREIVIVDRGESLSDEGTVAVFVHEVVHALQDQELDLLVYGADARVSFDAALALDAIIEGEAVHYQFIASAQLANRTPEEVNWDALYEGFRRDVLVDADGDHAPVAMARLRFPYAFGGGFVTQHWLARGRGGIDALFEHPPRTSSEVLFGTPGTTLEAERAALRDRSIPELSAPFEESASTALGAWIARMYAARAGVALAGRIQPARALGADAFSVHHDPQNDTVVTAWRARMLEGSMGSTWPASPNPAAVLQLDELQREAAQLAADSALPEGADTLAWRAPIEHPPSEDEAMASTTVVPEVRVGGTRVRACAVRHVPLVWR